MFIFVFCFVCFGVTLLMSCVGQCLLVVCVVALARIGLGNIIVFCLRGICEDLFGKLYLFCWVTFVRICLGMFY